MDIGSPHFRWLHRISMDRRDPLSCNKSKETQGIGGLEGVPHEMVLGNPGKSLGFLG